MIELTTQSAEMTAYYDAERKALKDQVHSGHLKEIEAGNGSLYVIHLSDDLGDLPVAMSNANLVIRSGDEVSFKRDKGGKGEYWETHMPVIDMKIDDGNREIEFRRTAGPDFSALRLQDANANLSAVGRQRVQAMQKPAPAVK